MNAHRRSLRARRTAGPAAAAPPVRSAFRVLRSAFRPRPAFTLVECLLAATVLALAVVAIAGLLAATYQQSAHQSDTGNALSLARALMEEIAAKAYSKPGDTPPADPSDRTTYDTVDDYDGYTDTSSATTTAGGIALNLTSDDGTPYTRTVTIRRGAVPVLGTGPAAPVAVSSDDFKAVTVAVTAAGGASVSITQVLSKTTD